MAYKATIKKDGDLMIAVLPKEVIKKENLKEDDKVFIEILEVKR